MGKSYVCNAHLVELETIMRYLITTLLAIAATFMSIAPALADLGDQLFKLLPKDGEEGNRFGYSVAISGNTTLIGASFDGSAYLFDTTTGKQLFQLLADDGAAGDFFGTSVGISGTTAIVGAKGHDDNGDNSGSAYIFDTITGKQLFKLLPNDGAVGDRFGDTVAISGTIAIVGALLDDDNGDRSGSAYLFDTNTGQQLAKLLPDDGAALDFFGQAIGINGATAIVGAEGHDDNGEDSGSAYLFDISDPTNPTQIFKLLPDDGAAGDLFGRHGVGISGSIAIVASYHDDDNGSDSGSAYLFDTTTGEQIFKLLPEDGATSDFFGGSVGISGTTAIVGAWLDDDNSSNSGSAYLFDTTTGQQFLKLLPEDGEAGDTFGRAVAISGTTAIVGARLDDDNGDNSGSAYLFDATGPGDPDIAVSISGGDSFGTPIGYSVHGWEFTLNSDIILTHLGLYDHDLDGFILDHDIGVFRLSDGALLTTGTMSVGTGDPLIDNFRYINVADVPLVTTENYVLSNYTALPDGDVAVDDATDEVFAPEVNWISGRWGVDVGGLIIPPNSTTADRYGPNFQFVTSGNCSWDLDDDFSVGTSDLLSLFVSWGPCKNCSADFDGDGNVGASDMLALFANWGPCP